MGSGILKFNTRMFNKSILLFLALAFQVTLQAQCPGPAIRTALLNLQKANVVESSRAGQIPLTDACGNQRYAQYVEVDLVPISYTPTITGNTQNFSEFVIASDSTIYFIDWQGRSRRFGGGSGTCDEDWLKIADNGCPAALTDSLYKYKYVSIGARYVWPDANVHVSDSASDANIVILGNRDASVCYYNHLTGAWSVTQQSGSTHNVFLGGGTSQWNVTEASGTNPADPIAPFDGHFTIDASSDYIRAHKYPRSRTDTAVVKNFLYTRTDGRFQSKPVAGLISADASNGLSAGTDGLLYATAGGGTPAGVNGNPQMNSSGSFGAWDGVFWHANMRRLMFANYDSAAAVKKSDIVFNWGGTAGTTTLRNAIEIRPASGQASAKKWQLQRIAAWPCGAGGLANEVVAIGFNPSRGDATQDEWTFVMEPNYDHDCDAANPWKEAYLQYINAAGQVARPLFLETKPNGPSMANANFVWQWIGTHTFYSDYAYSSAMASFSPGRADFGSPTHGFKFEVASNTLYFNPTFGTFTNGMEMTGWPLVLLPSTTHINTNGTLTFRGTTGSITMNTSSSPLTVNSEGGISINGGGTNQGLIRYGSGSGVAWTVNLGSGESKIYAGPGGYFHTFYANNAERFRLQGSTATVTGDLVVTSTGSFSGTVGGTEFNATGTGASKLPSGTTAQQPAHGAGEIRHNTTKARIEYSNGTGWVDVATTARDTQFITVNVESVAISGTGALIDGFIRFSSKYNGYAIRNISYVLQTAGIEGAGGELMTVRVEKNGSTVADSEMTFLTSQTLKEVVVSAAGYTVATGDLYRVNVTAFTFTGTNPAGMNLEIMLVR